jgi:hypothetical protein
MEIRKIFFKEIHKKYFRLCRLTCLNDSTVNHENNHAVYKKDDTD